MDINLIVYHNACPDGWCAAYIAKKKFPYAELLPQDHGKEPPYDKLQGKRVLVVDFSWRTREMVEKVNAETEFLQILDHHKTAREVIGDLPYAIFDMNRSGAGLTYDILFGSGHGRPWYVDYVEDRDLWRFWLPKSRAINSYLLTIPYTIKDWDEIAHQEKAEEWGEILLKQMKKQVSMAVDHTQEGKMFGLTVGVTNATYFLSSDVGEELSAKYDVGLIWFERSDGIMQFSLRSRGEIDVSRVAQKFNGGGHTNAAGFQVPIAEGRQILDQILDRKVSCTWQTSSLA